MRKIEHQHDWQKREVDRNEEEEEVDGLVQRVVYEARRTLSRQRMGPTEERPSQSIEITLRTREAIVTMHQPGEPIRA